MTASVGDNSGAVDAPKLRSFVERAERLIDERGNINEDIKGVLAEAKAVGFDVKIIRKAIKLRAMDQAKRAEEEALLELYCAALGLE
jgi:uncharacterized protein (UPF0335 family)